MRSCPKAPRGRRRRRRRRRRHHAASRRRRQRTSRRRPARRRRRDGGSQVYVCGIPEALQTIDALNGYFKRFGQITNLKIMPNSRNAFVSFANRAMPSPVSAPPADGRAADPRQMGEQ